MSITPRNDFLLIKPQAEEEEVTAAGIHLPEAMRNRPRLGEIIAVGPGKYTPDSKRIPLEFEVGETVMFNKNSAINTEVEGTTFSFVRGQDILVVLK